MFEGISVIDRSQQHALCISETVGTLKLGKVMGPAYQSIMDHIQAADIQPGENDIPFTVYKNIDWARVGQKGFWSFIKLMFFHQWEMEIGIPCPESVKGEGRIKNFQLEAGRYIRTLHKGAYRNVGETYNAICLHAEKQNLKLKDTSIEFYLNDPREVSESELETEVLVPIF